MTSYVALLRGINVGGRNPVRMPALVECFEAAGYRSVRTHLQSGNVLFDADTADGLGLETALDGLLSERFGVPIPTVVRSSDELATTVDMAPEGRDSETLRSEVFFLKRPLTVAEVMREMPELREGVDSITPGTDVLYFSRVAALARQTRITRFMSLPIFQQMTMRSWGTTTRLLELLDTSS